MYISTIVAVAVAMMVAGCTAKFGTNITRDRFIPPHSRVESIGSVSASAWRGQVLWAKPADREFYEEVRRDALKQQGGDCLINAKVTTTVKSYLGLYYTTEIAIEGTAAKVNEPPPAEVSEK